MNIDESEIYEPQEEQREIPVTVSKGPFYGLVLAIIGILFLISSIFVKPAKLSMTGTVTYASTLKQENGMSYQQIKVSFEYGGRTYETDCKVTNGRYSKYDTIEFRMVGNDPTNISTERGSSNKGILILFGAVFLIVGILLFLKIIVYEPIEELIRGLFGSFIPSLSGVTSSARKKGGAMGARVSTSTPISVVTDFFGGLSKKDNDRTVDDMEERNRRKKEKNAPKKTKQSIYNSDNILDLYADEDDEED